MCNNDNEIINYIISHKELREHFERRLNKQSPQCNDCEDPHTSEECSIKLTMMIQDSVLSGDYDYLLIRK